MFCRNITTAIFTFAVIATLSPLAAEAGCGGGGYGHHHSYYRAPVVRTYHQPVVHRPIVHQPVRYAAPVQQTIVAQPAYTQFADYQMFVLLRSQPTLAIQHRQLCIQLNQKYAPHVGAQQLINLGGATAAPQLPLTTPGLAAPGLAAPLR